MSCLWLRYVNINIRTEQLQIKFDVGCILENTNLYIDIYLYIDI